MISSMLADPVVLSAICIAVLNGAAYMFCKMFNPDKEAQRYYKHFEPIKFYVMEYCYTILLLSLSYNMRFIFLNTWTRVIKPRFKF